MAPTPVFNAVYSAWSKLTLTWLWAARWYSSSGSTRRMRLLPGVLSAGTKR